MEIKTKKVIGKIAAIGTGVLMAASTIGFAAGAVTLADYPTPFVKDNQWNTVIVAGADAKSADVVGQTNIAATLAQVATTPTEATITGAVSKDIALGDTLVSQFGDIDHTDIDSLIDTSIPFDEDTYNVHEKLILGTSTPAVYTSSDNDKDFGKDPVIAVKSGGLEYQYIFDEDIDTTNLGSDTPLEIDFLGKSLTITGMDAGADSITVQMGTDYYMNFNDTVTVAGKTVKLVNVGSNSVVVQVGSEEKIISKGSSAKVGGLRVKVKDVFYSDTQSERAASLVIGENVDKTYKDGEAFYIPCSTPATSGCSKDDPDWEWTISLTGSQIAANDYIGVKFVGDWDDADSPVIKEGQTMNLPENYLWLKFDSLKTKKFYEYTITFHDSVDIKGTSYTNVPVFEIKGPSKDSLKTASQNKETQSIYLYYDDSSTEVVVFYKDPTDGKYYEDDRYSYADGMNDTIFTFKYGDTELEAHFADADTSGGSTDPYLTIPDLDLGIATSIDSGAFVGMGTSGKAEAEDVIYGLPISTSKLLGELDNDVLFSYGAYIKDVKDQASKDTVIIDIPNQQQKVKAIIGTQGTKIVGGAGGSLGGVQIAKLDTEISDPKATNLILVGGPAVNRLTAQALGLTYPTYGADAAKALGISENQATIKLIENAFGGSNVALIVAGWEAGDTRAAAAVLQDYTSYKDKLVGKQVIVSGTAAPYTVTAPTVSA